MNRFRGHPNLGCFLTPRTGNSLESMRGFTFACDNGAFAGFDDESFIRMLDKVRHANPVFVTVPDVVGDAIKTYEMFLKWQPLLASYNLPAAYVIQDGQEKLDMLWSKIAAIFIGGSTEYKLSAEVRWLVREAKFRNKWVHMGRVNSFQRIQYAKDIGCDSIDGSGFSMFPDQKIPETLRFLENGQMALQFDEHF